MRYLVIAECVDLRTDTRFSPGDEFLPEPTPEQVAKLTDAGCIEPIPNDAPPLPKDDLDKMNAKQLADAAKAAGVEVPAGTKPDDVRALIRTKRQAQATA